MRGLVVALNFGSEVRTAFDAIIKNQVDSLRKLKSMNLSLNIDEVEGDSELVTAIKAQLKNSEKENIHALGIIGADLIQHTSAQTEALVAEAKELRRAADEKLKKARNLHNAQQHMLKVNGDALPLAYHLGLIRPGDISVVEKHIEKAKVKDYFGEQNKKSSD